MAKKKVVGPLKPHGYEFGGPLGAAFLLTVLPILCYITTFLCNDISGCPVPSVLRPSTLTWSKLKPEIGWPQNGILGLGSFKALGYTLGYYSLSLLLEAILPGQKVQGVELQSGGRLTYKFNAFASAMAILGTLAVGTFLEGSSFAVWTFIWENYLQIMTSNILISYALATFVYVRSFSVKAGNPENRELAAGGHSGNMIYDWFIGRELNPRIHIPILNHDLDIKAFCELRPGLLGWLIFNLTFIAHQHALYGYVTDSILLITAFQGMYVIDSLWNEPAILTTMDITTDGFGFMLAFGDLAWVPFIYSLQTRYLAVHPVKLGIWGTLAVLAVQGTGYYIFRGANNEKNRFRTDPKDPRVSHLKYMETKAGSKLLISGWWGTARHINYLGDWIMGWSWCLPTAISGYLIEHENTARGLANGGLSAGEPVTGYVVQGDVKGLAMPITYFYVIYFAILLIHRERRDEEKCKRKYGADWEKYKRIVRSRIIPGIY